MPRRPPPKRSPQIQQSMIVGKAMATKHCNVATAGHELEMRQQRERASALAGDDIAFVVKADVVAHQRVLEQQAIALKQRRRGVERRHCAAHQIEVCEHAHVDANAARFLTRCNLTREKNSKFKKKILKKFKIQKKLHFFFFFFSKLAL